MVVPRPVFPIQQENVGIAIVVVIDKGAARAHGFGQPLFSEGPVVVGEMDAGLRSNVAEVDLLRGKDTGKNRNPPQRHRGTEET